MKMRCTRLFLAVALLMMAVGLLPLKAQGQAPQAGSPPANAAQTASSALTYWTAERLSSAVPMDVQVDPNSAPAPLAAPSTNGVGGHDSGHAPLAPALFAAKAAAAAANVGASAAPPTVDPAAFSYVYPYTRFNVPTVLYDQYGSLVYPWTTVGKLFFTIGTTNYVCSASVIRPHLLVTARHCIFDYNPPYSQWAYNVVFYPGWSATNPGSNPSLGGAWPARWLYTWTSNAPNYYYDIGFIQLYDDDGIGCGGSTGWPIENYTGWLGYWYGGDILNREQTAFGYPAAAPFDGQWLVTAQAPTGALNVFGYNGTYEFGSDMTGGSSGGPVVTNWGAGNWVDGVNSFKFTSPNHSQAMNSPQFQGDNFNNLLVGAQGLACP